MKHTLNKITKQTDNKYVNMYVLNYSNQTSTINYEFASRRLPNDLAVNTKNHAKTDAVRMLPYFIENNKHYIIFTKEFRYLLNDYIYGLPAGLVDNNEPLTQAVARELKEEIGATTLSVSPVTQTGYVSEGLTDETVATFFAHINMSEQPKTEDIEDITYTIIPAETALDFLKNKPTNVAVILLVKLFLLEVVKQ